MKPISAMICSLFVLGVASTAAAEVSSYNGSACTATAGISPFDEARPSWVVSASQPRGITTVRGDRDVFITCPVHLDPTLTVGLVEFWAFDRHPNFDVRCTASLHGSDGEELAIREAGTEGSATGGKYFQMHFGIRGHTMRLTCSVPRFHSTNGHSIFATYHIISE